ncbi:MAG: hypothetical protein ACOYT8_02320 [Candidatus Dependentiae bacterium]
MNKLLCIAILSSNLALFTMDNTLRPMNKVKLDSVAITEFLGGMQTTLDVSKKINAESETNNATLFYKSLEPWIESYKYQPHLTYTASFNMETRYTLDELFELHEKDTHYQELYKKAKEENSLEAWNNYRIGAYHVGKEILQTKGVCFQTNPSSRSYEEFLRANKDLPEAAKKWLLAGNIILYYIRQIQRTQSSCGCPNIPVNK